MSLPFPETKLHIPAPRPGAVARPRLTDVLDGVPPRALALVSAPAGYGKTTLLAAWAHGNGRRVAWLSLDEGDRDPVRFLSGIVHAIRRHEPEFAAGVLRALSLAQPPPPEALAAALVNDLAALAGDIVLLLDDYHLAADAAGADAVIGVLTAQAPARFHLVIATREDPALPLARMRARGQLLELRLAELRFSSAESAAFLSGALGAAPPPEDMALLDARTEGWAAGLQLAALSLKGGGDVSALIRGFGGGHRFVLDYLAAEVLDHLPDDVRDFLLRSAALTRMCGPLCDAALELETGAGARMLARIERDNLFLIPLDDRRHWYRYHHLFAELLQQRGTTQAGRALLQRASVWCEQNELEFEAFDYAVRADDHARAARIAAGRGMPLHFRGGLGPVLRWLEQLPAAARESQPALDVMHASALLFAGRLEKVEMLCARAERALPVDADASNPALRDLLGRIASIRATLAVSRHDVATIETQAARALACIDPGNLPVRSSLLWNLGYARYLKGERPAAFAAYTEGLGMAEELGHQMVITLCELGLGNLHEEDEEMDRSGELYRHVIVLCGEPAQPVACQAHLGLGRIAYASRDYETAGREFRRAEQLARQLPKTDRAAAAIVWQARAALAVGDAPGARVLLARADRERAPQYAQMLPAFANDYAALLFDLGELDAAAAVAARHTLPLLSARIALARNDHAAARTALDAFAQRPRQDTSAAERRLAESLRELLAGAPAPQALVDPLSERELEVLRLIAEGLSNQDIAACLHLALSSVKGHNLRIFGKLQVRRRTEAIARARALGLL